MSAKQRPSVEVLGERGMRVSATFRARESNLVSAGNPKFSARGVRDERAARAPTREGMGSRLRHAACARSRHVIECGTRARYDDACVGRESLSHPLQLLHTLRDRYVRVG